MLSGNLYLPDNEGRLLPRQWRHNLKMETFVAFLEGGNENDLMTEEAFRIYNAGLGR